MIEPKTEQISLFGFKKSSNTPAEEWSEDATKHGLDELFNATYAYRNSKEFMKMMRFVSRFRFYSPYNALLIRLQRPGARFVATPTRWKRDFDHYVKPKKVYAHQMCQKVFVAYRHHRYLPEKCLEWLTMGVRPRQVYDNLRKE